jgi:DnaK suppressor protein
MAISTQAQFKKRLEEEQTTLEAELSTIGRINPENPADWEPTPGDVHESSTDLNDFADTIETFETNTAVLKQLETQLGDVKDALVKIEDGSYGVCEECQGVIEEGRLDANPAARTCVAHM